MSEKKSTFIFLAAVFGFLAVAIGAFGAHGLEAHLSPENKQRYETAVQYHFYHTLALFLVGILVQHWHSKWLNWSAYAFSLGIILFSGSLYIYAITSIKTFAMITPIGGLCFLIAWACLFASSIKRV
jgi:uncharacterized membrane protein YgdD (TMEM256/DUF423 family)